MRYTYDPLIMSLLSEADLKPKNPHGDHKPEHADFDLNTGKHNDAAAHFHKHHDKEIAYHSQVIDHHKQMAKAAPKNQGASEHKNALEMHQTALQHHKTAQADLSQRQYGHETQYTKLHNTAKKASEMSRNVSKHANKTFSRKDAEKASKATQIRKHLKGVHAALADYHEIAHEHHGSQNRHSHPKWTVGDFRYEHDEYDHADLARDHGIRAHRNVSYNGSKPLDSKDLHFYSLSKSDDGSFFHNRVADHLKRIGGNKKAIEAHTNHAKIHADLYNYLMDKNASEISPDVVNHHTDLLKKNGPAMNFAKRHRAVTDKHIDVGEHNSQLSKYHAISAKSILDKKHSKEHEELAKKYASLAGKHSDKIDTDLKSRSHDLVHKTMDHLSDKRQELEWHGHDAEHTEKQILNHHRVLNRINRRNDNDPVVIGTAITKRLEQGNEKLHGDHKKHEEMMRRIEQEEREQERQADLDEYNHHIDNAIEAGKAEVKLHPELSHVVDKLKSIRGKPSEFKKHFHDDEHLENMAFHIGQYGDWKHLTNHDPLPDTTSVDGDDDRASKGLVQDIMDAHYRRKRHTEDANFTDYFKQIHKHGEAYEPPDESWDLENDIDEYNAKYNNISL